MISEIIVQGSVELGLSLSAESVSNICEYLNMLEETNRVMDLTAVTEQRDMARVHVLDSLAILSLVPMADSSVIDVGSGAGLPGMVLKMAQPSIRFTALDARGKRIEFLSEVSEALSLSETTCVSARAEEAALLPEYRESFDFAVARAVSRLNELCELCLPFVKPSGRFIAMKGKDSDEEIDEAARAIEILGGKLDKVWDYLVPGTDVVHRLVVVEKISATPMTYPRRYAKIQKRPL